MKKRLQHVGHAIITYRTLCTCASDKFFMWIFYVLLLLSLFLKYKTATAFYLVSGIKQFKIDNILTNLFVFFMFCCHIFHSISHAEMWNFTSKHWKNFGFSMYFVSGGQSMFLHWNWLLVTVDCLAGLSMMNNICFVIINYCNNNEKKLEHNNSNTIAHDMFDNRIID